MPETWIDHLGRVWRVPTILGRLKFKVPSHAALRVFVFRRDDYTCQDCGVRTFEDIPDDYDGRHTFSVDPGWCLVMDHVISRANGGSHHPDDLLTLCDSCNARKVGLVDLPMAVALRRGPR